MSKFRISEITSNTKVSLLNKRALARWLESKSFKPRKLEIHNLNQMSPEELYEYVVYRRVVIKPSDASGSRGVHFIGPGANKSEILKALNAATACSPTNEIIVEDYIEGEEYSIEVINSKQRGIEIICVSRRHMFGTQSARAIQTLANSNNIVKKLSKFIRKFITLVGHVHGLLHIEVIVDKTGYIHVIDIGERGGGYWVADKLAQLKLGMNINLYMILVSHNLAPILVGNSDKEYLLLFGYPNETSMYDLEGYTLLEGMNLTPSSDKLSIAADASRCSIKLYEKTV